MTTDKRVHTIVLDAGPIIKNSPAVSSLLAQAENLVTTPAIISEIRDAVTRSRAETTLLPFLTLREPRLESVKVITEFARRTGDLAVLSKQDIGILALAYELECERNGGDWRLRRVPGQKRVNGAPPSKDSAMAEQTTQETEVKEGEQQDTADRYAPSQNMESPQDMSNPSEQSTEEKDPCDTVPVENLDTPESIEKTTQDLSSLNLTDPGGPVQEPAPPDQEPQGSAESDSDSEGWITPSNIKKHIAKDTNGSASSSSEPKTIQVACITSDFAMQNVLLQMNLNLLSPSFQRIQHIKTFILRCHACFLTTKEMDKQFCPRCGKPTLTRVSCSTDQNGEFKLHLKKNMQWNKRGARFSVPKPVAGSANGRVSGGGKGGWGKDLILAEDQKEYVRAVANDKRLKQRDLMDEDYLPSILTGDRGKAGGRPRVGAGRTVNSRKR